MDPGVNAFGGVVTNAAEGVIGPRALVPPAYDMTGTWQITDINGSNNCGDPVGEQVVYPIMVTANGNDLAVMTPAGTYHWTMEGTSIEWTGSFPEQGGITTITSTALTATDANHFSGTLSWTWTDGVDDCAGSNTIMGVRQ